MDQAQINHFQAFGFLQLKQLLAGAIAMGFGNTGPITHLQDLK